MAIETYFNDYGTSLSGSINNSTTSVVVSSAAAYPSPFTGLQIRIRIDDEIMVVTAINTGTNTFTVTRGAEGSTAASHASGAHVLHMLTAGGMDGIRAAMRTNGTIANLPTAGKKGNTYWPTDGTGHTYFYDNGSSWEVYAGSRLLTTPPSSSWTWANQGSSTAVSDAEGIQFFAPAASGVNIRQYYRTKPSPPYTLTAGFAAEPLIRDWQSFGISVYEVSSAKSVEWRIIHDGTSPLMDCFAQSNNTSNSGRYYSKYINWTTPIVYLRIQDDGTNRIYSYMTSGVWSSPFSHSNSTFITGDALTVCLDVENTEIGVSAKLVHWSVV